MEAISSKKKSLNARMHPHPGLCSRMRAFFFAAIKLIIILNSICILFPEQHSLRPSGRSLRLLIYALSPSCHHFANTDARDRSDQSAILLNYSPLM
jgi:hypothetical protein